MPSELAMEDGGALGNAISSPPFLLSSNPYSHWEAEINLRPLKEKDSFIRSKAC
jgi:hypothetical protein